MKQPRLSYNEVELLFAMERSVDGEINRHGWRSTPAALASKGYASLDHFAGMGTVEITAAGRERAAAERKKRNSQDPQ